MQLEFHQLDQRWEPLRVRQPHLQRRLLASLADAGQQTPIIVVAIAETLNRYLVIDGHKRIAALRQLGRDTVEAAVWAMSEAEALLLERSMRMSQQESTLEQGWLLLEMAQRFHYSLEELARRFDRSLSWVSRRLALAELLPEVIQQQVRDGNIPAQLAMKYLVPMARVNVEDCERMAAGFVKHRCDNRQSGLLYAAWRDGSRVVRERILTEPELFLKTQRPPLPASPAALALERELEMAAAILRRASRRLIEALPEMNGARQEQAQRHIESARDELERMAARIGKEQGATHAEPSPTNGDCGTEGEGSEQARNCAGIETLSADRAHGAAIELHQRAGIPAGGESRAVPATNSGAIARLQGESRASP